MFFYLFAAVFVILEISFFNHLQILSARPNLILFLITIFSFYFNFSAVRHFRQEGNGKSLMRSPDDLCVKTCG